MTTPLTRTAASAAVDEFGWRYLLGEYLAAVPVDSIAAGVELAARITAACGDDADTHLRLDVRPRRVHVALCTAGPGAVTQRDVALARTISRVLNDAGVVLAPVTSDAAPRPVQTLEIAIDALDIEAIRPFWRAVLGYVDDSTDAVIDPDRQGPAVWFQQLDEPRPQRNRIHFDITVAHDEAPGRIRAALDAGGVLVSDAAARRFWILADAEGNEICVCTWQDRDPEPSE